MQYTHSCLSVQTATASSTDTTSQTDCQNWLVSCPGEHVTQTLLRSSYTDIVQFGLKRSLHVYIQQRQVLTKGLKL